MYEDNQALIKSVLAERITPQARPLDVLIAALHELHPMKIFEMLDTRSNKRLDAVLLNGLWVNLAPRAWNAGQGYRACKARDQYILYSILH